ncbi:ATP-binding protein [Streptomyces sp. NBC_01381]|uniref:ATP-binding protein n=1 Tax=Streptomyces sp. NBC_01381 TaxID=2903845 RepID=UPI0022500C00|nr:ATP-binding protein [Streptomyces sp. NBC_01381]MCX4666431.1 ATP-binding protein [Streptomyces sp. NBC_01381]
MGAPLDDEAQCNLELLAGEVIANAVTHTEAPCAVFVLRTDRRVRVEVTDVDAEFPTPVRATPDDEGGRGLLLVQALSAAWGRRPDSAGKTVWFEVAVASASSDSVASPRGSCPQAGSPAQDGPPCSPPDAPGAGLATLDGSTGHHAA